MSITLANESDDEYCGRVYLCQEFQKTELLELLTRFGLYIAPHSTQTIDLDYVYISSRVSDTLRLHVLYDIDLFTDSVILFDDVKEVMVADRTSGIMTPAQPLSPLPRGEELYNLQGQQINSQQPGINISRKRKLYIR